jgi:hypothetical protein
MSEVAQFFEQDPVDLREFSVEFARMIASLAVDPHGYFEKKYTAKLENATSEQEVCGVLTQLVQWAASSSLSESQHKTLNRALDMRGFPSIDDLRLHFLP